MNGMRARGGCPEHRFALVEFAARRASGPGVTRALDHVEGCRACEDALAATTLVLHGLRRLHEETARAEPSADGWARLRARLAARRREPSRLLSGLPGILVAAGLCAAVAGPGVIGGRGPTEILHEAPGAGTPPHLEFEESRERAIRASLLPERDSVPPYSGTRSTPPPITADLPPSFRRHTAWSDGHDEWWTLAPASERREEAAQGQAGRR